MRREEWDAAVALFERTRGLPADACERILDEVAGRDATLARRVREMLRADAATHPLLDGERVELGAPAEHPVRLEGLRVGPYDVLREIGRGGMGAVYLARRRDVDKDVALKLVTGGTGSPERVARFLHERRVLARLEHPDIARLMDAGVTADGTPWLAMEYVEGHPIDVWCDARRLPIRGRIEIFIRVCDAIAYAHRNLIVHRDLKPANILVTAAGEPRLLDFGIARLLDPDNHSAAALTREGPGPMTPEFASPEQIRGDPITTASDVYQLGALLFRLLAGIQPHRARGRPPHEVAQAILEGDVPRLSQAVPGADDRARRTARELRGDLETIVSMSMRPDPDTRYASAQQLADDLRRHLDGEPVLARPHTVRYRASKFVRRNRAAVAAGLLIASSLVAATGATTWQARRATEQARLAAAERDRANAEALKAAQVATFLTDVFRAADPDESLGRDVTAREVLARGVERLRGHGELNDQPLLRAELLDVLGRVYRSMGAHEEARPLLEEALALRREHHQHGDGELAESLTSLGLLALHQGRTAEARALLEEALAGWHMTEPRDSAKLASGAHNLAAVYMANAEFDTAEAMLRQAIAIRRALGETEANSLAQNLSGLGIVLSRAGRLEAADSFLLEALEILPDRGHPDVAANLTGLGVNALRRGDAAAAEPYLREALEIRRAVYGTHTTVAGSLNNLGSSLERQGRIDQAEAAYRESLEMRRALIPGDHTDLALSLNNLGLLLVNRGDLAQAEPLLRESLAMRRRLLDGRHPDIARAAHNLAILHDRRGEIAGAAALYAEALEIRRDRLGPADRLTLQSALALAEVRRRRNDQRGAIELASWVLEVGTPVLAPDDSLLAGARRVAAGSGR